MSTRPPSGNSSPSRTQLVLHALAVATLSAYPLSLMLRENLGIVPIPFGAILLILFVDLAVVGTLFVALRLFIRDVGTRLSWLSLFFLLMGLYVAVVQQVVALGWPLRPDWPSVGLAYIALSAFVATCVVRPWRVRRRDPVPMFIVGIVLFGTNTAIGVSQVLPLPAGVPGGRPDWRPVATALTARAADRPVRTSPPERDIYYLVLDGFGSQDTLRRLYELDLTEFVGHLAAKGFQIVDGASSNYVQTYLSLASTMNLDYLNDLAAVVGPGSADRTPLAHLIDHNAIMTLAKRAGYEVVGIGSDYHATERLTVADRCRCGQFGSDSTTQAMLAAAPLLIHAIGQRFADGHRRKVLDGFIGLEQATSTGRRLFVFAHVLAPHPPFVFAPDGGRPASVGSVLFQDGSAFGGTRMEYREGYRNQLRFIARRVTEVVDTILSRPGPPPVIVIHGDHGPGMYLHWNSADESDMNERTGIFAAYFTPGATQHAYHTMTPVNGARLLANEYFGTDFPLVDDRTYFSTWGRPYDFIPVPRPGRESHSTR